MFHKGEEVAVKMDTRFVAQVSFVSSHNARGTHMLTFHGYCLKETGRIKDIIKCLF